jgi:hypothetical protein
VYLREILDGLITPLQKAWTASMGRKSLLTAKQWEEIKQRLINGEKPSSLADEYRVSRQSIHNKLSLQTKSVKSVACKIVDAEQSLQSLPVNLQISACNLASDLLAISANLASGAKLGSMTFRRLSGIANKKAAKLDDDEPAEEELIKIAKLTRTGNESATVAIALLNANKDKLAKADDGGLEELLSLVHE